MRRALVALLFLLPALPVPAATFDVALAAGEPEGWEVPLVATIRADAPATVAPVLEVAYAADGWDGAWSELWPEVAVDGNATAEASFLARHGAGAYTLVLRAGEAASAPVEVVLEAPGPASDATNATWDGGASGATLRLTSDSVNADGKLKSPGEDVVTRYVAEDPDGLGGEVVVEVRAGARVVHRERVALPSGTTASLEHRFAASPLAAGTYEVVLATAASSVSRTFVVRDVAAVVVSATAPARVRAGEAVEVVVAVGDRNADAAGRVNASLVAKTYRVTTAVPWTIALDGAEGEGALAFAVETGADDPTWRVVGDAGVVDRALAVHVPATAAPATYRLAVFRGTQNLGEAAFDVVPPPSVGDLRVVRAFPGEALVVEGATGGVDRVRVTTPHGDAAADVAAGRFRAQVPLPRGLAAGTEVRVEVDADGALASLVARVENAPPTVALGALPPRLVPGARLPLDVETDDANGETPSVSVRVLDAGGRSVAEADGDEVRVPKLPRGRYAVEVVATDAAGATASARGVVDVAPWTEAAFLDDAVAVRREGDALVASARVANVGTTNVTEAIVLAGALVAGEAQGVPALDATLLLEDGTNVTAEVVDGRARLPVHWPPGPATLVVRWPRPSAAPLGEHAASLVLVVRGEAP